MLHRYTFTNFQSFREPTEVNLRLSGKTQAIGWERRSKSGERVGTALAVVGANASGKTALLKPLAFLDWFIKRSFHAQPQADIPVSPHFSAPQEPTDFVLEAEDTEGVRWRYELRVTRERVWREALYKQRTRGYSYVFVRQWHAGARRYDVRQKDFGFDPTEARKVRSNASLVSTAAQYGVPLALRLQSFQVQSNVTATGRVGFDAGSDLPTAAAYFAQDTVACERMGALLAAWDLGLSAVELRELTAQQPGQESVTFWFPFGMHQDRNGEQHALPFMNESSGTQSAFVLLSRVLPVLMHGGVAVIDEFENDLHPHMIEPILELFSHHETNPHHAQILFTCHAMEVLNVLHKSQVMLVEKDAHCESAAWRMDAIKGIRNDDNFYAKYMAGAYGAVPQL